MQQRRMPKNKTTYPCYKEQSKKPMGFNYTQKPVHMSGFQWPLHWQQVLVWVFSVAMLITELIITLLQEQFSLWAQVLAMLIVAVLAVAVFVYNYKATAANTEDPVIEMQREHQRSQVFFDPIGMATDGTDLHLWCQLCSTFVNESSKHCGSCNRCSYEFDHHCNWLNTCVGFTNYNEFYRLIWTYLFFIIWFGVMAGFGLIEGSIYRKNVFLFFLITGELLMAIVGFIAIIDLINMHRWLRGKNMTTFEYIIYSRELSKTQLEVKKGILDEEAYKKWKENYFANKVRYKSKVIVEKKDAQVIPMQDQTRPRPELPKIDVEDYKNQQGTNVVTEDHQSILSPRLGEDKSEVPKKCSSLLKPPIMEKDSQGCCSQMYCVPCIVAKEEKQPKDANKDIQNSKIHNETQETKVKKKSQVDLILLSPNVDSIYKTLDSPSAAQSEKIHKKMGKMHETLGHDYSDNHNVEEPNFKNDSLQQTQFAFESVQKLQKIHKLMEVEYLENFTTTKQNFQPRLARGKPLDLRTNETTIDERVWKHGQETSLDAPQEIPTCLELPELLALTKTTKNNLKHVTTSQREKHKI